MNHHRDVLDLESGLRRRHANSGRRDVWLVCQPGLEFWMRLASKANVGRELHRRASVVGDYGRGNVEFAVNRRKLVRRSCSSAEDDEVLRTRQCGGRNLQGDVVIPSPVREQLTPNEVVGHEVLGRERGRVFRPVVGHVEEFVVLERESCCPDTLVDLIEVRRWADEVRAKKLRPGSQRVQAPVLSRLTPRTLVAAIACVRMHPERTVVVRPAKCNQFDHCAKRQVSVMLRVPLASRRSFGPPSGSVPLSSV